MNALQQQVQEKKGNKVQELDKKGASLRLTVTTFYKKINKVQLTAVCARLTQYHVPTLKNT